MNLQEIKAAVEAGKIVHWASRCYIIVKDTLGQWMVHCPDTGAYWGLCKGDGTLSDAEDKFFLGVPPPKPKRQKKRPLLRQWFEVDVTKQRRRFEIRNVYGERLSLSVTRKQLLQFADEITKLANS